MQPKDFAERRERLLSQVGAAVVLLPAAAVAQRNADTEHPYRQNSDLWYLSGFEEAHSLLLLTNRHPEHRVVWFVQPRHPEREQWDGARAGLEGAKAMYGADAAYSIDELATVLPTYLRDVERLHYRFGVDRQFDAVVFAALDQVRRESRRGVQVPTTLVDLAPSLHEMRLRKSPGELELLRQAARISTEAHVTAMQATQPGAFEYEIEAQLLSTFRRHGSERPAYECIVGSGVNATVLHYRQNRRRMLDGELLLIDAGCEFGYYAADITRTFPVNGRFSSEQRALYEVVLGAQLAAIGAARPGATLEDVHQAALRVLVVGLIELGLLRGSLEESLETQSYKPFFMHRTSHWLGMDVHDVGVYYLEGKSRPLEPGFVLTVEPGLYIAADAAVEERWRGLGIRIEDDVVVTAGDPEVLTAGVPKSPDDIEQLMRR